MYQKYIKRLLDIAISFTALLVLSPVLLVVAVLVRTRLGSPVIFHQDRPGYREKVFRLCKFRSMTDARGADGELLPDAVRLTRFGKALRATSLDELPELWNILKGDMSLIGPRPLLVKYLPLYNESQRRRHDVKPGLTGWAQINGRDELEIVDKAKLDGDYVKKISFPFDVKCFIGTIFSVAKSDGVVEGGTGEIHKKERNQ